MIEVGAGYGRWIANAAAALKRRKNAPPSRQRFVAVEANQARFNAMTKNLALNNLSGVDALLRAAADRPDRLRRALSPEDERAQSAAAPAGGVTP